MLDNRIASYPANDDFCMHFDDKYLELKSTVPAKLTAAMEIALDYELDVEVVVVGDKVETMLRDNWPEHWPERQILNED